MDRIRAVTALALVCLASLIASASLTRAVGADIVISQVYGGGGNSGATLTNDFVELHNRTALAVDLSGWSVQYASSSGTSWIVTPLAGTIPPGGYYLIAQAAGSGGSVPLPTPDATGTTAMSASSGKVALVPSTTALSGSCPVTSTTDLVGYGSANCFEGSAAAPTLSNTTAALRAGGGDADSDDNAVDFAASAPMPRNSSLRPAAAVVISQVYGGGGNSGATLRRDFVELRNRTGAPIDLAGWSVQYASSSGTSWSITPLIGTIPAHGYFLVAEAAGSGGTVDLPAPDVSGSIAMSATSGKVALVNGSAPLSGSCPVTSTTDLVGYGAATCFEGSAAAPGLSNTTAALRLDNGAADTDDNAADFTAGGPMPRNSIPPAADVVISQVYGGGGNSGATLRNDFVELHNRGAAPASLAGWSVQYASSSGTSWIVTSLGGTIPAGGYYLVQQAAGSGGTEDLPVPDAVGTTSMSATSGKVALRNSGAALSGACPLSDTEDLVGYGSANCFEGSAAAPAPSNTTAAVRAGSGSIDTDDNAADFAVAAPSPRNTTGRPPTGTGLAMPSAVQSGDMSLLAVAVIPGTNPESTGISVVVDLTPIAGSASQQMFDDGTHGDITAGDLTFSYDTVVTGAPGTRSLAATVRDQQSRSTTAAIRITIEPPVTTIAEIQGAASRSPVEGQLVATEGVVTALRSNGYYIQMSAAAADGDASTSDGIFVFTNSPRPAVPVVGDEVRVTGTVQEFSPAADPGSAPITEISGSPAALVISSGNPLPAAVPLDPSMTTQDGGFEQLERFEGMRVVADITAVSPTSAFSPNAAEESNGVSTSNGDFYAVLSGLARPMREPGLEPGQALPPGAPAGVPRFDGNPERLRVDSNGQAGAAPIEIAAGQSIQQIAGVLDYSFRAYTLLPDPGNWPLSTPPAAQPVDPPGANEFTVASFNIERFFDDVDAPNDDVVMTPEGLERRLAKASLNIRHLLRTPDILGVVEVENLAALEMIAARVNADAAAASEPNPGYVAYLEEGNDPGGIDVGFLVKSARVDTIAVTQVGRDATYVRVDNGEIDLLNDRPPLVLEAAVHGPVGEPYAITAIVNHLRSLNGVEDPGPAGARVRQKRRLQAEFLASYIQSRQEDRAAERLVVIGDFNAFEFSDGYVDSIGTIAGVPAPADQVIEPSPDLVDPNLVDAGASLGPQRYSFVFDGNAQALDHVLLNAVAAKRFSRLQYVRGNTDFPESLRADATRPERLSDHDAAIAYFAFPGAPVVTLNGAAEMTVEAYTSFTDPGATASDVDLGPLPVTVAGSVDVDVPGTYVLAYSASNGYLTTTVTRTVHVVDSVAPTISGLVASPDLLWPPRHGMVEVTVDYTAADASGVAACVLAVGSNEPQDGLGDGDTESDWEVLSPTQALVRAERSGTGDGRVYTMTVICTDASGNSARAAASVRVPLRR